MDKTVRFFHDGIHLHLLMDNLEQDIKSPKQHILKVVPVLLDKLHVLAEA